METHKVTKPICEEDMTPEQREKWLLFYRKAMQRKRETQAEMRQYRQTKEYKESVKRLTERNAERGTPFI